MIGAPIGVDIGGVLLSSPIVPSVIDSGVYVKKRKRHDLVARQIEEERRRREAIYDALHPAMFVEPLRAKIEFAKAPSDTWDLAGVMVKIKNMQDEQKNRDSIAGDEDDIEFLGLMS